MMSHLSQRVLTSKTPHRGYVTGPGEARETSQIFSGTFQDL